MRHSKIPANTIVISVSVLLCVSYAVTLCFPHTTQPCDPHYQCEQNYTAECSRQHIDTSRTQFIWEVSKNGKQFTRLHQDTLFTSTRRRVLDPVYLEQGLHVRCIATAVDRNGVRGYSRVSRPVQLIRKQRCFRRTGVHLATLTSYPGFRGRKDVSCLCIVKLANTVQNWS